MERQLRILDLFCGLKGWSQPFADRGHHVQTLDIVPAFNPTYVTDILSWDPPSEVPPLDVILASPPCEKFSTMNIGRNWNHERTPKNAGAELALKLVARTREIDRQLAPAFLFVENPRAMLRKLAPVADLPRVTVTYCRYGYRVQKPTDIWGRFPATWHPRPACHSRGVGKRFPCYEHASAPRGSYTGTQAKKMGPEAARISYALALEVCLAVEAALGVTPRNGSGTVPEPLKRPQRTLADSFQVAE